MLEGEEVAEEDDTEVVEEEDGVDEACFDSDDGIIDVLGFGMMDMEVADDANTSLLSEASATVAVKAAGAVGVANAADKAAGGVHMPLLYDVGTAAAGASPSSSSESSICLFDSIRGSYTFQNRAEELELVAVEELDDG